MLTFCGRVEFGDLGRQQSLGLTLGHLPWFYWPLTAALLAITNLLYVPAVVPHPTAGFTTSAARVCEVHFCSAWLLP